MKTADENDNGSTFINDTDMRLSVKANTRYVAILNLIVTSGAAGTTSDLKYNMTLPSGSTELGAILTGKGWFAGGLGNTGTTVQFDLVSQCANNETNFVMQYWAKINQCYDKTKIATVFLNVIHFVAW